MLALDETLENDVCIQAEEDEGGGEDSTVSIMAEGGLDGTYTEALASHREMRDAL